MLSGRLLLRPIGDVAVKLNISINIYLNIRFTDMRDRLHCGTVH
jgi:hypothetical protein